MATLSSSESVEALQDSAAVPAGCAVSIVSEECSAYIMLKGIMDPAAELDKLDKRLVDTTKQSQDLQKKIEMPSYQVPPPFRALVGSKHPRKESGKISI